MDCDLVPDTEIDSAIGLVALYCTSAPVNGPATSTQTNNRSLPFSNHPTTAAFTTNPQPRRSEEEMSEAAKILVAMAKGERQPPAPSANTQQKERAHVVKEPAKDDSEATLSISSRSSEEPPSYLNRPAMRPRPHKTTVVRRTIAHPPAAHGHVRSGLDAQDNGTVEKPIVIDDSSDSDSDSDAEPDSDAAGAARPFEADAPREHNPASSPWVAKLYDTFLDDVMFQNLEYNVKSQRAGDRARKAFTIFQDIYRESLADHSTMQLAKDEFQSKFTQAFESFVDSLQANNRNGISNIKGATGNSHEVVHDGHTRKATLTPKVEGGKLSKLKQTDQAAYSTSIGSTQYMDHTARIAADRREMKTRITKGNDTGTKIGATNTLKGPMKHNTTTATKRVAVEPQQSGSTTLSIDPDETIENYSDETYSEVGFYDHANGNGGVRIDSHGADKSHAIGSGGTNTKKRAYDDDPDPFWRCHIVNKKR